MAPIGSGTGRLSRWLTSGMLSATLGISPVAAQETSTVAPLTRLRAGDQMAARLLAAGMARSATFRGIVDNLEQSDLIVYVETRPLKLPGQLQFVAATPVCRHVRVSIQTPGLETDQVAWLAHELWHAGEIAATADVRDQASLLRFYERTGYGGRYSGTVESIEAQEAWTKVLYEMRGVR